VGELITAKIAKLGENIRVSRMARFKVGESDEQAEQPESDAATAAA
jgi:translation elongation factor EF-Ts